MPNDSDWPADPYISSVAGMVSRAAHERRDVCSLLRQTSFSTLLDKLYNKTVVFIGDRYALRRTSCQPHHIAHLWLTSACAV